MTPDKPDSEYGLYGYDFGDDIYLDEAETYVCALESRYKITDYTLSCETGGVKRSVKNMNDALSWSSTRNDDDSVDVVFSSDTDKEFVVYVMIYFMLDGKIISHDGMDSQGPVDTVYNDSIVTLEPDSYKVEYDDYFVVVDVRSWRDYQGPYDLYGVMYLDGEEYEAGDAENAEAAAGALPESEDEAAWEEDPISTEEPEWEPAPGEAEAASDEAGDILSD